VGGGLEKSSRCRPSFCYRLLLERKAFLKESVQLTNSRLSGQVNPSVFALVQIGQYAVTRQLTFNISRLTRTPRGKSRRERFPKASRARARFRCPENPAIDRNEMRLPCPFFGKRLIENRVLAFRNHRVHYGSNLTAILNGCFSDADSENSRVGFLLHLESGRGPVCGQVCFIPPP
jgi:hypothetical protein